jgi:hypothetical protein
MLIVVVGFLYVWILVDWRRGVLALAVVLPFAGVPVFVTGSEYALVGRDVAIGLPLYASLLVAAIVGLEHLRLRRSWFVPIVLSFATLVALNIFLAPSLLIGLVGAKVWLFYIPMMGVGYRYLRSTGDALWLLKLTALLAIVPATLGIVEWIVASHTGDLGPFSRLYGSLTDKVNGQSVLTNEVRFTRIPSTFTSVSQYVSFCYVALTAALALALVQRSARWLTVAGLIGTAALTSGARGAFLIAPLLILLGVLFSGFRVRRALVAIVVTAAIVGGLIFHGADPQAYRSELSAVAAVDGSHALGEFRHSWRSLYGDGTGSHTNAALRYGNGDVGDTVENWYARAGTELGVVGLALAIALLACVGLAAWRSYRRLTGVAKEIGGPIMALVLLTALISFKGPILDVDPFNVYFWLFVGFLARLPSLTTCPERETP